MGYFVWYSKTSKEYRNFLPNTRRVILICDVKLMEEKAFRRYKYFLLDDQSE